MREQERDDQSSEQDFKRDVAMLLLKREERETRETETERDRERRERDERETDTQTHTERVEQSSEQVRVACSSMQ